MTLSANRMGVVSFVLLALNSIIGSGLFLIPGQIAAIAGNWGLLVYLIVTLIVMAIGWCFVKCATLYSQNGGAYLYAKDAFGHFAGFQIGFMRCAVGVIAWASLAVGFITALGLFWPILLTSPYKQIFTISLITSLGILNLFGVKVIKKLNNVMMLATLLPLAALLIGGLFYIQPIHLQAFEPPVLSSFGPAALVIFFAFSGFEAIPVAAGEVENPKRNVPIALLVAISLCALIYFWLQVTCIGVLGENLASSVSPLSEIAAILWGSSGKAFVYLGMLISIGGITIVASFLTPRSLTALAENGMVPPLLAQQNRFGAPALAILVSVVATTIFALSGSFLQLITISVVSRFMQYIVTALALYAFEKKGLMQPFDRPWKRIIPVLALAGVVWLILYAEIYQLLCGFGALFIGIPLYFMQKNWQATN